jgi:nanoRNase/pAp phosphatase (c-di-AMP/oligoRNAs hydrolase)
MDPSNNANSQLDIRDRLERLRLAAGSGPLLILTHDNPDPDSLASGKTLAHLFQKAWGITSHLIYSGLVTRAENQAMLHLLTPEWQPFKKVGDWGGYSAIALVDTQPGAGNNSLPLHIVPQIVIDHHHPLRSALEVVPFVDIQTEVGSTVSLIYLYLDAAGVTLDAQLATAIFYGIQTDTRGLTRGSSTLDQDIYFKLLPLIDHEMLVNVEQAGLPREYFRAFVRGLQSARLYQKTVVSYLGAMHRPDFVAEIADILIRLEEMQAVLCMGYHGATLYLSLRTAAPDPDAGLLIQSVISGLGKAGGHGMMAGGQVPLANRSPDEIAAKIEQQFVALLEDSTTPGTPLL